MNCDLLRDPIENDLHRGQRTRKLIQILKTNAFLVINNFTKTHERTPKCNGVLSPQMESKEKETNFSPYPILVRVKGN